MKTTEQYEKELQQANETIQKLKLDNIIEKELIAAKAKNVDAVKSLIDTEQIDFDGKDIIGLDEQIQELKSNEKTAFLFDSDDDSKLKNRKFRGFKPEQSRDTAKKPDISKMNYTELCKFLEENPDYKL